MERDVLHVQLLLLHLVPVYLAFVLREKTFNFFTLEYDVICGLSYEVLIMLRYVSYIPLLE